MLRTFGIEPVLGSVLYLAYLCVILLAWHRTRRCSLAIPLCGFLLSLIGYFVICLYMMGVKSPPILYLTGPAIALEAIGWLTTAILFYHIVPSR